MITRQITPLPTFSKATNIIQILIDQHRFEAICRNVNSDKTIEEIQNLRGKLETFLTYFNSMDMMENEKTKSIEKKESNKRFKKIASLTDKLISEINAAHETQGFEVSRILYALDDVLLKPREGIKIEDMIDQTQTKAMYEMILFSLPLIAEIAESAQINIPANAPKASAKSQLAKWFINIFDQIEIIKTDGYRKKLEIFIGDVLMISTLDKKPKVNSLMRIIDHLKAEASIQKKQSEEKFAFNPMLTKKWI